MDTSAKPKENLTFSINLLRVYRVEILLIMDNGPLRNM